MDVLKHITLFDKLSRDVVDFDASLFRAREMGLEVKILCKSGKPSTRTRDDADGNQFDRLKGASFGTNVARVDDGIALTVIHVQFSPSLLGLSLQTTLV